MFNLKQTCIASDAVSMARVSPMNCSQICQSTKQRSILINKMINHFSNKYDTLKFILFTFTLNMIYCSTPLSIKTVYLTEDLNFWRQVDYYTFRSFQPNSISLYEHSRVIHTPFGVALNCTP